MEGGWGGQGTGKGEDNGQQQHRVSMCVKSDNALPAHVCASAVDAACNANTRQVRTPEAHAALLEGLHCMADGGTSTCM